MLALAERMDLSQNVFQDGTWGTLRYRPPPYTYPLLSAGHDGGCRHGLDADDALHGWYMLAYLCVLRTVSAVRKHITCLSWGSLR